MQVNRHPYDRRYTALIKFSKVERYREGHNGRMPGEDAPIKREVTETEVVVRAATLEKLQAKVTAHVALLDEQDLTDTELM